MIKNDQHKHRINRFKVINIYETDYNLILKYFWPHKTTQFADWNNILDENQWDGRSRCNTEHVALLDEMNTEYHRMRCWILCTFQNDAICYFDRMISSHAMLNCRKFGGPDQACIFHAKELKNKKYYLKTSLETVKKHTPPNKSTVHGIDQGSKSSGTN